MGSITDVVPGKTIEGVFPINRVNLLNPSHPCSIFSQPPSKSLRLHHQLPVMNHRLIQ